MFVRMTWLLTDGRHFSPFVDRIWSSRWCLLSCELLLPDRKVSIAEPRGGGQCWDTAGQCPRAPISWRADHRHVQFWFILETFQEGLGLFVLCCVLPLHPSGSPHHHSWTSNKFSAHILCVSLFLCQDSAIHFDLHTYSFVSLSKNSFLKIITSFLELGFIPREHM